MSTTWRTTTRHLSYLWPPTGRERPSQSETSDPRNNFLDFFFLPPSQFYRVFTEFLFLLFDFVAFFSRSFPRLKWSPISIYSPLSRQKKGGYLVLPSFCCIEWDRWGLMPSLLQFSLASSAIRLDFIRIFTSFDRTLAAYRVLPSFTEFFFTGYLVVVTEFESLLVLFFIIELTADQVQPSKTR